MSRIVEKARWALTHSKYGFSSGCVCAAWLLASVGALRAEAGPPTPGLHTFTQAVGKNPNPPMRAGGPLTVSVGQSNGAARFILPGTREMDPAVFGTPARPAGFEMAPFPMSGISLGNQPNGMPWRLADKATGKKYTIVNHFSPFSDWSEPTTASVKMTVVDATAIDGAYTKDKIDFEANFELPDGAKYKVVCKMPLAHGKAFPFFGGVVTNHLIHGAAGIAPRLLPTDFAYAAFWGKGDVYKDGSLINKGQLVHVWVSEDVRAKNGGTRLDAEAGNLSKGLTLHMIVPPYRPVPGKGMVKTPLKTMFMPFPLVKPNIKKAMQGAMRAGDKDRLAEAQQMKAVADATKDHIVHATADGKMFGMPFIHMKFDAVKMQVKH